MEHYVTLFDSLFLPQGIALHRSMQRHAGPHTLWVVCVDRPAFEVLSRLALPDVRLIDLSTMETPDLLAVKPERSRGEYCWTLTPFAPGFVFDEAPDATRVTYVDADLWLRASPKAVFAEFERSGKSVLITDHLPAAEQDHSATNGRFCVQFLTFSRTGGEVVRRWWAERCLEWCYARLEDGRFGDQKYLDSWPERFADDVHVLSENLPVLGPWNAMRFPYGSAFAMHFHGLRLLGADRVYIADNYQIPEITFRCVYRPYFSDLSGAVAQLAQAGFAARPQAAGPGRIARIVSLVRRAYWMARVRFRRSTFELPGSTSDF